MHLAALSFTHLAAQPPSDIFSSLSLPMTAVAREKASFEEAVHEPSDRLKEDAP